MYARTEFYVLEGPSLLHTDWPVHVESAPLIDGSLMEPIPRQIRGRIALGGALEQQPPREGVDNTNRPSSPRPSSPGWANQSCRPVIRRPANAGWSRLNQEGPEEKNPHAGELWHTRGQTGRRDWQSRHYREPVCEIPARLASSAVEPGPPASAADNGGDLDGAARGRGSERRERRMRSTQLSGCSSHAPHHSRRGGAAHLRNWKPLEGMRDGQRETRGCDDRCEVHSVVPADLGQSIGAAPCLLRALQRSQQEFIMWGLCAGNGEGARFSNSRRPRDERDP